MTAGIDDIDWGDRTDWADVLEAARQPVTPEQRQWDAHFERWRTIARQSGRTPNAAATVAQTRTEAQYGQRPTNEETT